MGRLRLTALLVVGFLIGGLTGCGGSGNGTTVVANPVPAIITLTPGNHTSLELGKTVGFIATPERADTTPVSTPVQFVSSNNAVVTIASNGLACAGRWDSLSNPQICTPGQSGVAQITAQAEGVSSPTTTVYVHPHVDKIVISPAPSQTPLIANCISKGQHYIFQATALSLGTDVTADVGPFTWSTANASMLNLTIAVSGLTNSQVQATTTAPGITTIAASLGSANSIATPVTICPVQSITLKLNGSATNTDLFVPIGTTLSASATTRGAAHPPRSAMSGQADTRRIPAP